MEDTAEIIALTVSPLLLQHHHHHRQNGDPFSGGT